MDFGHFREVKEIEIAQIDLRYAHTRIQRPERLCSLSSSIERFGQILPVIVLREGVNSFVLIDGYLRVNAVRRCLRDTVMAEIWECKEAAGSESLMARREEALVEVLARTHSRKWDLIEEAALIRELHDHSHLSQSRIASLLGRKQGWVSGRLALYHAFSEDLLWSTIGIVLPFRIDPKGGDLDLGGHPGHRPYCARNAGAWKGAFGESFQSLSVHAGDGPVVPPLPEGQSEAERQHRA